MAELQEKSQLDPSMEKKLKGHKDVVTALDFSRIDNQLSSSSLDFSVMVWNIKSPIRSYRFLGHSDGVMDVAYSPTGKFLASVSRDKTVRLWVPNVTGNTGQFKGHTQTIRSVQFSADGAKLITGSDDKSVKLWCVQGQKFMSSFVGHTNWVKCARFSNDNSVIASCSDDKTTRLWDVDSGDCVHTYAETKGATTKVAWHPTGCYVAVALSNGTVKLYDTRTHSLLQHYRIHDNIVNDLTFHPSGNYLLTCAKDNKMKLLDLMEGHPIYTVMGHTGAVTAVAFSQNGDYFASGGDDKEALINWRLTAFLPRSSFNQLITRQEENIDCLRKINGCIFSEFVANDLDLNDLSQDEQTPRQPPIAESYTIPNIQLSKLPPTTTLSSLQLNPILNLHLSDNTSPENRRLTSDLPSTRRNPIDGQTFTPICNQRSFDFDDIELHQTPGRHSTPINPRTPRSTSIGERTPQQRQSPRINISVNQRSPLSSIAEQNERESDSNLFHNDNSNEPMIGLITLKDDQYCYTDGIIEWVGKKRLLDESLKGRVTSTPLNKTEEAPFCKKRKLSSDVTQTRDVACHCPDILPTVNAIVNHLNAMHDALDMVDERLTQVEDTFRR